MSQPNFGPPLDKASADPRRWVALAVLLLASFMNLIDVTIVNVALPSLQTNLGADSSHIEWVIAAYVLAFALGLLPFGRLGDIVGRKKMFLWGVSAFTLASALCGLAPTIEALIGARALQGIGAAMMTPQVLAIAQVTFPPQERGQAFSLFGLASGLASVCGPILGGVLISMNVAGLDWRPIFLVNVPFGILAVVAGTMLIRDVPGNNTLKNDYVGIGIFGVSILLLVYSLIEGRAFGWPVWIFGMMVLAAIGLALFTLWERNRARVGAPQLLNFDLLTNRTYMLGVLTMTIYASGIPGMFMVISLLFQAGFGLTPLESGLTNTPFSVGVLLISFVAGRLGSNYLKRRMAVAAFMLMIGMIWLHFIMTGLVDTIDRWAFMPPLFIAGMGLGLGFSSLFQAVLSGVPHRDAGSASGALQAFQQVGGALGVALVGQIFFSTLEGSFAAGAAPHSAFAGAAATAMYYQIASFGLVLLLVPFLRVIKQPHQGQAKSSPPPVVVEA
ncbi:DHA2 family efflux MFS transporter permease subunit [Paradevosia shaoguanensis]|uniref:DHA2 family efflux MFS transporter permease subunit n=1 Tax=Paradevosia shaoguanensis TaxID=1335043 RepID=A0AA41QIW0_9HYPH|nr:DHA2 family efflux MFS transporter permease subunit [Paradevosia shaoguanensis]MCF1740789.1 DHA2 family efflux MFS transporter permease subunit [Paradevosia shaoguanensis]MCI0125273.1 DHA2 family efflux MFS transporter permease subunit [Paradevosia shaoguanensis]